eukprot:gene1781-1984_t
MNQALGNRVSSIFSLSSAQGRLTHEQRLNLKKDGRPCPKVEVKNRDCETVYSNFLWICGDAEKNTYFCWPCLVVGDLSKYLSHIAAAFDLDGLKVFAVMFQMKTTSFARESGFQSSGGNLWNLAKRHEGTKMHIVNHTAYQLLGNVDVACALDEARHRQVEQHNKNANKYSRMVKHHIDAVVFLSAQGIAFRGHDESKLSSNRGNFIELLDLIGHYSSELEGFLEENITYTSHEPQNDFIECAYEEVKCEIQKRIDNSQFVAVMMDDTSDVSGVEQSAVSVRLINNGEVEEHLLGIIDCSKDTTASALTDILLTKLQDFKITPENGREKLIGQSYNGAATMSGELNGVQKRVQDKFPAAYYNHCVAHRLSLCALQTANQIPQVARFFDTVDKPIRFFRKSPKRTSQLGHSLPLPGDTRWLSRDMAISVVDSLYESLGTVLYELANDHSVNTDTQVSARGLCVQIQHIEFAFLLKFYRKIFAHCAPILPVMQNPTLDATQLLMMLEDFQAFLLNLDSNQVLEDAMILDPEIPSVRQRNGWRGVESAIDSSESWKQKLIAISTEVTQKFTDQLLWRFSNLKKFEWMDLIHPSKFAERRAFEQRTKWRKVELKLQWNRLNLVNGEQSKLPREF